MVACARAEMADPREVEVFHIWNRVASALPESIAVQASRLLFHH